MQFCGTLRGTVVAIESIGETNCDHYCRRPMMIGSPLIIFIVGGGT